MPLLSPTIPVLSRRPLLAEAGLAVEHFPAYAYSGHVQHAHDFLEVSVILGGRCRHVMGPDEHVDEPGAVGITHYHQTHALVTPWGPVEVMNLYLDLRRYPLPVLPPSLQPILPAIVPLHPSLLHRLNRRVRLHFPAVAPLRELLWAMHEEQQRQAPGYLDAMDSYLRLFLIACCRRAQEVGLDTPLGAQRAAGPLERVRQYLDQHFARITSLAELAGLAGMARGSLCRAFRQHTGKTLVAYRRERQIEQALLLLRQGEAKIIAIADDCGFRDVSYFNRTFRRLVGQSPRAYREQWRRALPALRQPGKNERSG
jgi:AraC-like DNA-binding protein